MNPQVIGKVLGMVFVGLLAIIVALVLIWVILELGGTIVAEYG